MTQPQSFELLTEIEEGALDETADLSSVLRKCIALGGQNGSESLRAWATRELKGYHDSETEIPTYRVVPAPIAISGQTATHLIKGQSIRPGALPEPAASTIKEEVSISSPLSQIVEMVASARRSGDEFVMIALPSAQTLATLMNGEAKRTNPLSRQHVSDIYWEVSCTALVAIIDNVRTTLVELVAEIRAEMPTKTDLPSAEVTDQAVNFAVYGKRNKVKVITNQVGTARDVKIQQEAGENTNRGRRGLFAGLAAIVTAVGTVLLVLHH